MKSLLVIPHKRIGPLKLGMSPEEILAAIHQMKLELGLPDSREIIDSQREENDSVCFRYLCNSFFFLVRYRNHQAIEIGVNNLLRELVPIVLLDMDIFRTTAEELVKTLKKESECFFDLDDEELSRNYEFPELGIRLWREEPFHPKLWLDKNYMEEMATVIEEMEQYRYFELVAVF